MGKSSQTEHLQQVTIMTCYVHRNVTARCQVMCNKETMNEIMMQIKGMYNII